MKRPPVLSRFVPVGELKPTGSRIDRSFEPVRTLRVEDTCSLKLHFTHAAREVVGYIDKLASLEHERERFVYARIPDIVEHCKRYNKGEGYKRRTVMYVMAFLRDLNIISELIYRKQPVGNFERYQLGFVVAEHDNLFFRNEYGRCEFVGMEKSPSTYERPTQEQNARQGNWNAMTVAQRKHLLDERTRERRKGPTIEKSITLRDALKVRKAEKEKEKERQRELTKRST